MQGPTRPPSCPLLKKRMLAASLTRTRYDRIGEQRQLLESEQTNKQRMPGVDLRTGLR